MSWEEESMRRQELVRVASATARRYPHLSVVAIARLYQASVTDVWHALAAAGIERPRRNAGDELCPESLADDVGAGLSVQAMSRKYDVPEVHLRQLLPAVMSTPREAPEEVAVVTQPEAEKPEAGQKLDLSPYRKKRSKKHSRAQQVDPVAVARLRAEGMSWSQISASLKVGQSTAHGVAKRHGFQGNAEAARRWLDERGEAFEPAEPPIATAEVSEPEADETMVRCVRRGLSGAAAKSLLERFSWVPADECRYDVQIILREVV